MKIKIKIQKILNLLIESLDPKNKAISLGHPPGTDMMFETMMAEIRHCAFSYETDIDIDEPFSIKDFVKDAKSIIHSYFATMKEDYLIR